MTQDKRVWSERQLNRSADDLRNALAEIEARERESAAAHAGLARALEGQSPNRAQAIDAALRRTPSPEELRELLLEGERVRRHLADVEAGLALAAALRDATRTR